MEVVDAVSNQPGERRDRASLRLEWTVQEVLGSCQRQDKRR